VKKTALLAAALALSAAACSTLSTKVDFDPVADFSRYKSYSWKDTGEIRDPVWSRRVEDVLEDTVAPKGLKQVKDGGDLWMAVHARFSVDYRVEYWNSGWGYGWGWGPAPATVSAIPVGTIVVDLVDAKRGMCVWRGVANDTLRPDREPEEREKTLRKVMAELFATYPPAKK
jgi:hypothetical protein